MKTLDSQTVAMWMRLLDIDPYFLKTHLAALASELAKEEAAHDTWFEALRHDPDEDNEIVPF